MNGAEAQVQQQVEQGFSLLQKFHEGGIFMWAILAFAIFTLAFVVERTVALYFTQKTFDSATFRKLIFDRITRGDLAGATQAAGQLKSDRAFGPIARVASTGTQLRASGAGDEELQARMDEKLNHEISKADRRTGFLAMFGNVATLLGLLGTIVGMIHSFAAVANANPADRATLLSKGISEAMNCTAFGLIVAIPALVAYAIFQNRTDRFVSSLTEGVTQIYHDLLFFTEVGGRAERGKSSSAGIKVAASEMGAAIDSASSAALSKGAALAGPLNQA